MSALGTTFWTLGGVAAFVLAALWADRIVRQRRAEAAAEAAGEGGDEAAEG